MTPGRTSSTIANYRRRVEQLRRQAAADLRAGNPRLISPMDLIEHLMSRKQASRELVRDDSRSDRDVVRRLKQRALTRNTWRQYKGALLFVLEEERKAATEGVLAEELDVAIERLRSESQTGCLKKSHRTSSRKLKAFPAADCQQLVDYLKPRVGVHKHANTLLTWIRASRLVGLRPSEWRSAGLVEKDGRPALSVGNAKTTNGRGNGETRHFMLDRMSPADIEAIDDLIYLLVELEKEPDYDFDVHMQQLVVYMGTVTRRCLGPRARYPTLYSFRHQLVANLKSGGRSREEIAALTGHGSNLTAGTHYGRTAKGEGDVGVYALASEVATVRQHMKARYERSPRRSR